jgi:hypothetical protein
MAQDVGIGIFAAFIEAVLLQPTLYWKNAVIQGKPFTLNPQILYRGSGASIFNECGAMGLQFGLTSVIHQHVFGGADYELISACGGGMIAAVVASPVELIMIQQQNTGLSTTQVMRMLKLRSQPEMLFRGFLNALARDAIYVGAMLGVTPVLKKHIEKEFNHSPRAANLEASLLGGIIAALPSHPFDLVKTCMQGDLHGEKYSTASKTFATLWAEGGYRRLFSGGWWRTLNITATVYIANEVNIRAHEFLNPSGASSS